MVSKQEAAKPWYSRWFPVGDIIDILARDYRILLHSPYHFFTAL